MIQNVEWDSQHFNMNVGIYYVPTLKEIFNLESLEHEMKEYLYDVVYVRCKIPVIELENKHTFRDERIVYTKDNSDYPPPRWPLEQKYHCVSIRSCKNNNITNELIQLALASGEYSRYKLDERFDEECFVKLYKDWIVNSIDKDFATDVLVASVNNHDVGLLTYKITDRVSSIGLLAVAATHRGLHIGKYLMQYYQELL